MVTTLALGACALGVLTLNTNGLSTEESYTKEFPSVTGQKVLTEHGLADTSTPVMVVANAEQAPQVADGDGRHREPRGSPASPSSRTASRSSPPT